MCDRPNAKSVTYSGGTVDRVMLPPSTELERHLVERWQEAAAAWPSFSVPLADFVARVPPPPAGDGGGDSPALDRRHFADLYLSAGCLRGDSAALAIFHATIVGGIRRFIAHLDPSPQFADDVRQELVRKLLLGSDSAPPALQRYSGRGPLVSFVAIAAQRIAIDLIRTDGRLQLASNEAVLEKRLAAAADPEIQAIKAPIALEFGEALRAAIDGLGARERMILRLTMVSGLSLAEVGAIYGVSASTVCRWIGRTRDRLVLGLRRHLAVRGAASDRDVESLARLVRSELDISLEGLLLAT